jgi:hypothetical protein
VRDSGLWRTSTGFWRTSTGLLDSGGQAHDSLEDKHWILDSGGQAQDSLEDKHRTLDKWISGLSGLSGFSGLPGQADFCEGLGPSEAGKLTRCYQGEFQHKTLGYYYISYKDIAVALTNN